MTESSTDDRKYRVEIKSGGSLGTTHYLITASTKAEAKQKARRRAPRLSVIGSITKVAQ